LSENRLRQYEALVFQGHITSFAIMSAHLPSREQIRFCSFSALSMFVKQTQSGQRMYSKAGQVYLLQTATFF